MMRRRLTIDLFSHDPDSRLILAWVGQLTGRRRGDAVRRVLASGLRTLLGRAAQRRSARLSANAPTVSPVERPRLDSVPARRKTPAEEIRPEPGARAAAVARRFRLPLITGGLRYDSDEHAHQSDHADRRT